MEREKQRSSGSKVPKPQVVGTSISSEFFGPVPTARAAQRTPNILLEDNLTDGERRWALIIVISSGLDVIVSSCIMAFALDFAIRHSAVSLYGLAVQALSHIASSLTLLLRFLGAMRIKQTAPLDASGDSHADLDENQLESSVADKGGPGSTSRYRQDLVKEQAIAIAMGTVLMLASAGLSIAAAMKMRFWSRLQIEHSKEDVNIGNFTRDLSWWGCASYSFQGLLRLLSARTLRKSIVLHASLVTVTSMLFFLILAIAASLEREWSWKAEPIAAMVLAAICLLEGMRVIGNNLESVDLKLKREALSSRI
mmetsp:Transcript_28626/g.51899  ORF Transcript_28626/g.51899 Transcript_28626/m.51899 type:complete len:310 (-) Transcript_28626:188-1117(-)